MQPMTCETLEPGLFVLEMLLHLHGVNADAEQLRRLVSRRVIDLREMRLCVESFGFNARFMASDWKRLTALPLPGIAALKNGGFLLIGKATKDKAIVLSPGAEQPLLMTRNELEQIWDGRLLLIKKRSAAAKLFQRLGRLGASQEASEIGVGPNITRAMTSAGARILRRIGLQRRDEHRRRADEIAFLPAALEIVETPPSPLGRAITFTIMTVFGVAVAWASIGTVDIVALAPGKIVPSGRTKAVQPLETGVVRAIHIQDGQNVKAGDVLLELDATMSGADLERLKSELVATRLDVARLRAALARAEDPVAAFVAPPAAPRAMVEMQRRFLASQAAEQSAKLAEIDRQLAQKKAERTTIKASIDKLVASLAPLQDRVEIREQLQEKGLGSKITYLAELQELVSQQKEIVVQESRYKVIDAAIASLVESRSKTVAEYERILFDELAKAEQKATGLAQDVIKAEQRKIFQKLTAPVDGKVQQLSVHTVGGVVTPAQTLMLVVPAGTQLEIEAMISNRDIGFVEAGQRTAIKVDTFNYTRYGLLHGKIISISQDAIQRDQSQDSTNDRTARSGANDQKAQELAFAARISIESTQMQIDNKLVNLSPGMAVTVEVKTGSRRIISYLLSPLVRYQYESLRER